MKFYTYFLCIIFIGCPISGASTSTSTTAATQASSGSLAQSLKQTKADATIQKKALTEVADKFVFMAWPEYPNASFDHTKAPLYPSTSINEEAVEALYGANGLKVSALQLACIKAFYFYLEYCTRREMAAKLLTLASQKSVDALSILEKSDWKAVISAVSSTTGSLNYASITPTQDSWNTLPNALLTMFTHEKKDTAAFWTLITKTSFWTDITVTNDDLKKSLFWQDLTKVLITKSLEMDNGLLQARVTNEQQLFRYIPFLETSYYLPDYTQQRYTSELLELSFTLNEHTRNRLLPDCTDWSGLKTKTGTFDFAKIVTEASCYQRSHFYQLLGLLSKSDCDPTQLLSCDPTCDPYCDAKKPSITCDESPFKITDGKVSFQQVQVNAPYRHEMIFLSMGMTLQTLLYDLFRKDALEKTLTVLATAKKQPALSILPFALEDGIYLEDWNALSNEIPNAAEENELNNTASKQFTSKKSKASLIDDEPVKPQGFADWAKSWGKHVADAAKGVGEDLFATAKDVAKVAEDEGKVLYYESGLATALGNVPAAQAAQLSQTYKDALSGDFTTFGNDVSGLMTNVVKLAETVPGAEVGALLAGIGAVLNDPSLASDYQDMLDAAADAIGTAVGKTLQLVGDVGTRLTTDAICLLTQTTVMITTGQTQSWLDSWKILGTDLVASFFETVTVTLQTAEQTLADVIKAAGYLIKIYTDAIIDVGAAVAAVYEAANMMNFSQIGTYFSKEQADLDTHRQLISQIVTVGMMLGATVATGGIGWYLAFAVPATLSFGSLMCVGGEQGDVQTGDIEEEITTYLNSYTLWTRNQIPIVQKMQNSLVDEVNNQLNAEVLNKQISLGYYANFFKDSLNQYASQMNYALGAYQNALFTTMNPNASPAKIALADVGSSYGFRTGWFNLNPSLGFAVYEPSRNCFAQEVAQLPATFAFTDPTTKTSEQIPYFWFLQNVTMDQVASPASAFTFELRFKPIYILDSFYIGFGIGGTDLNTGRIAKENIGNIDRYREAKIAVIKQEPGEASPSIGVYEHETTIATAKNDWLYTEKTTPLILGTWYHLQGILNGNSLELTFWQEGKTKNNPVTVTVTPLATKEPGGKQSAITKIPLSVIFSGASMEFDIVNPSQKSSLKPLAYPSRKNAKAYTAAHGPSQTEAQREIAKIALYDELQKPSFGDFDLVHESPFDLIKGYYIYTTTKTSLPQTLQSDTAKDFMVFASLDTSSQPASVSNIGISPLDNSKPNGLISLITGTVYTSDAIIVASQSNIWTAYQTQNEVSGSRLTPNLIHQIATTKTAYGKSLTKPLAFGSLTLTPISAESFSQNQFVFTTTIDKQKDYVVLAQLTDNGFSSVGLSPVTFGQDNGANGIVSLVTYNVYNTSSCSTTSCTSIATKKTESLITLTNSLSKTLKSAITKAQKAHTSPPASSDPSSSAFNPTNPGSVATSTGSSTPVVETPATAPQSSINIDQQNAAGGGW